MSEPSSLYAKIQISPLARQAFLNSNIKNASAYQDWIPWLSTKKFSGTITQANIDAINYQGQTVGTYLNQWIKSPRSFGINEYDPHTHRWVISMYEFSENYLEYIHFLHVLRGVDHFKDLYDQDFILVHSYHWGDTESDVAIKIGVGESTILTDIPDDHLKEASLHLEQRQHVLSEQFKD